MSLAKLKKAELIALAESHGLSCDPDWNKDEIIEGLEAEGITAESVDNEVSTDIHSDGKPRSKAKRQNRRCTTGSGAKKELVSETGRQGLATCSCPGPAAAEIQSGTDSIPMVAKKQRATSRRYLWRRNFRGR